MVVVLSLFLCGGCDVGDAGFGVCVVGCGVAAACC